LSASLNMRSTTSRRSFLVGRPSISREAEGLISRLYLATPPEIANETLEREVWFRSSLLERGKILSVFSETQSDRIVHEIRHGTLGLGSLVTQCFVDLGRKVHSRPLLMKTHGFTITSKRYDGKMCSPLRPHALTGARDLLRTNWPGQQTSPSAVRLRCLQFARWGLRQWEFSFYSNKTVRGQWCDHTTRVICHSDSICAFNRAPVGLHGLTPKLADWQDCRA